MEGEYPRPRRRSVLQTIAGGLGVGFASAGAVASAALAVKTDAAEGLTSDAATLSLTLSGMSDNFSVQVFFEYGEAGTLDQESDKERLRETSAWSTEISDLEPDTTYDYRAVAEGDEETVRGEPKRFITSEPKPQITVSTSDPQSVSHNSAAFWGELDEAIDVSAVDVAFEWRKAGASSWNTTWTEQFESTGTARHYVDGLSSGTTYEYRITGDAVEDAVDDGSIVSVTTDESPTLKASTGDATDVADTTATLTGTLDAVGDSDSPGVSFRWGLPSQSGDFPPNAELEQTVSSTGEFDMEIGDLEPNTTYEYWAVAAGLDVDRGAKRTVTTTGPILRVSTGTSSSTDTSITIAGELDTLGGADSVDVAMEYREAGTSDWLTAGSRTRSAPGPVEATVDDLPEETDYEYRAVADAGDGDTDAGDSSAVSTSGDPEIATKEATNVTGTSARLRGEVLDNGGATIDVSFEWGPAGTRSNTTTETYFVQDQFSGETVVAADIEGLDPGTTYDYRAVIDADDGESDVGSVVSVTTDTDTGPIVDSLSVDTGTRGPHAAITATWSVSDPDGNLDSVTVEVLDDGVVDSASGSVSGASTSGTDSFSIERGAYSFYDVRATVTDSDGQSTRETRTVIAF